LFCHKQGVKLGDRKLLNKDQEAAIQKMSIDVVPDQLKLDYALWTTEAVRDLIAREFGITIGRGTVGNYINAWRFTPQKPKKRVYEQCSKKVRGRISSNEREGKTRESNYLFGDETGVKNSNHDGRHYAPKEKNPVKKYMSKRFSIHMISTATNQGLIQFMTYTKLDL
jgi:hypothetical protein